MNQNFRVLFLHCPGNLLHRQSQAGFVVHQHGADQSGFVVHRPVKIHGVELTVGIGGNILHLVPFLSQLLGQLHHRSVFDGGGDDFIALPPPGGQAPADGQVIAFGGAGGEVNLLRHTVQPFGQGFLGAAEELFRLVSHKVQGSGVSKFRFHGLHRRIYRLGADPGGGAVVQINQRLVQLIASSLSLVVISTYHYTGLTAKFLPLAVNFPVYFSFFLPY